MTLHRFRAILFKKLSIAPTKFQGGNNRNYNRSESNIMERIKTLETSSLCESAKNGGCGECQTSCQSACKTSCGVANQKCENEAR